MPAQDKTLHRPEKTDEMPASATTIASAPPPSYRAALPVPIRDLPTWLLLDMGYAPPVAAPVIADAPKPESDHLSWLDEIASGFGAPLEDVSLGYWEDTPTNVTKPNPPAASTSAASDLTQRPTPIAALPSEEPEPTPLENKTPLPASTQTATEIASDLAPLKLPRLEDAANTPTEPGRSDVRGLDEALAGLDHLPKKRLATSHEDGTDIDVLAMLEAQMREAKAGGSRGDAPPRREETNIDLLAVFEADLTEQADRPAIATDTDITSDKGQLASIMAVLGNDSAESLILPEATHISTAEPTIIGARRFTPDEPTPPESVSAETPAAEPAPPAPEPVTPLPPPPVAAEQDHASPTIVHLEETSSVIVANLANEIPDDPDEAIAWLEKMAQESSRRAPRRKETRSKMPTVSASIAPPVAAVNPPTNEPATPTRMAAAPAAESPDTVVKSTSKNIPAPPPAAMPAGLESAIPETLDDALAWLDELVSSEKRREELEDATEVVEPLELEPDAPPSSEEEIAPPDILVEEADNTLDWLDRFAAEQDFPAANLTVQAAPEVVVMSAAEQAQAALAAGDFAQATPLVEQLLAEADSAENLLPALQTAVELHPTEIGLQRWLGDAYLRQGRAADAAAAYRQALMAALTRLTGNDGATSSPPHPNA